MTRKTMVTTLVGLVTTGALAVAGVSLASAGQTPATATASGAAPTSTAGPSAGAGRSLSPAQRQEKRTARLQARGLTGETAVKVTQAATAAEPAAVLLRVYRTGESTYAARMLRPDGTRIVVAVDGGFQVTSVTDAPTRPHGPGKGTRGQGGTSPSVPPTTGAGGS